MMNPAWSPWDRPLWGVALSYTGRLPAFCGECDAIIRIDPEATVDPRCGTCSRVRVAAPDWPEIRDAPAQVQWQPEWDVDPVPDPPGRFR